MPLDFLSRLWYRHMEDFVTWVDTSKLKRTIMQYNDEVCFNLFYFHCSLTQVNSWTISIFYSKKRKVHSENETHGIEIVLSQPQETRYGWHDDFGPLKRRDGKSILSYPILKVIISPPPFCSYDLCHHSNHQILFNESGLRLVPFCC